MGVCVRDHGALPQREREENLIGTVLNLRTTTCRNVQRFRGGLVFKAHRLCVSLNSMLASNKDEEGPESRRWSWQARSRCPLRSVRLIDFSITQLLA